MTIVIVSALLNTEVKKTYFSASIVICYEMLQKLTLDVLFTLMVGVVQQLH